MIIYNFNYCVFEVKKCIIHIVFSSMFHNLNSLKICLATIFLSKYYLFCLKYVMENRTILQWIICMMKLFLNRYLKGIFTYS